MSKYCAAILFTFHQSSSYRVSFPSRHVSNASGVAIRLERTASSTNHHRQDLSLGLQTHFCNTQTTTLHFRLFLAFYTTHKVFITKILFQISARHLNSPRPRSYVLCTWFRLKVVMLYLKRRSNAELYKHYLECM